MSLTTRLMYIVTTSRNILQIYLLDNVKAFELP